MRRILVLMTISLLTAGTTYAQPKKSRVQRVEQATQQQKKTQGSSSMTRRMQISYPVALDVPEDVVWRRDIYRELNLSEEANAGLYYPVQPQGKQMNLFTYIFKLAQHCQRRQRRVHRPDEGVAEDRARRPSYLL